MHLSPHAQVRSIAFLQLRVLTSARQGHLSSRALLAFSSLVHAQFYHAVLLCICTLRSSSEETKPHKQKQDIRVDNTFIVQYS
jgi:hypothetical protein